MKSRSEKFLCSVTFILLFSFINSNVFAVAKFGTLCQKVYEWVPEWEHYWQDSLDEAYVHCGRFIDELNDTDESVFYYDLINMKPYIEDTYDDIIADHVDLLYILTHGGVTNTDARWAMWNKFTNALSSQMRLGDDDRKLQILVSCSCHTLQTDGLIARWRSIFRGGLKYALGSHDIIHMGKNENECGKEFADNLQDGDKFKYAWKDAFNEPFSENVVIAVSTGNTESECEDRRDLMKWQNFGPNFGRLRDS